MLIGNVGPLSTDFIWFTAASCTWGSIAHLGGSNTAVIRSYDLMRQTEMFIGDYNPRLDMLGWTGLYIEGLSKSGSWDIATRSHYRPI